MTNRDHNFIKYEGPAVADHTMDAQKLARSILGLNSAFKKFYSKEKKWVELKPVLRIKANSSSYEIAAIIAALAYAADKMGLTELTKGFFSEMGKQLALRKFAQGKELKKEGQPTIEGGKMFITVVNVNGDKNRVEAGTFYGLREFDKDIESIVDPVEPEQINRMRYGYEISGQRGEDVVVEASDKAFFVGEEALVIEEDLEEDFDDKLAEEIVPMRGKLVAYQALATKYPFQFQPREKQDVYGKRFISCILADESKRDDYIELMKSYVGNVVIHGRGIKDEQGRYRKIKITRVEKDENPSLFE